MTGMIWWPLLKPVRAFADALARPLEGLGWGPRLMAQSHPFPTGECDCTGNQQAEGKYRSHMEAKFFSTHPGEQNVPQRLAFLSPQTKNAFRN
jgi:hypothetical protein